VTDSTSTVDSPPREIILLVRLSAIGDVLQCLHALADLRAARPDAAIHWLVEDRCSALVKGHPQLDGIVVYERRRFSRALLRPWLWPSALLDGWRLVRALRALRPTVSVDLQGNLKGALLARLSGAPRRIGLAAGEGGKEKAHLFATERVTLPPPPVHRSVRARALVAPLGVTAGAGHPTVAGIAEAGSSIDAWLAKNGLAAGSFAVLHPGTSGFGEMKRWPAPRYSDLAERLRADRGLAVLVTAGPGEGPLADEVVAGSRGAAMRGPETKSLAELGALLVRAAVVVAADTGPAHLAALLGAPTVTLFGPKNPAVYAPVGPRASTVWKRPWCSPCTLRRCDDSICMTELETDDVLPTVMSALGTKT
jgi:ADP-heptose:LPS heptosyltransferase